MTLSRAQQAAGRDFRAAWQHALDAMNLTHPPGGEADPLHRTVRHACPGQGGASVGIELAEHRKPSQEVPGVLPAGLLSFVWKDGRCPDCGLVLRSSLGRVALTADLQPLKERKVA